MRVSQIYFSIVKVSMAHSEFVPLTAETKQGSCLAGLEFRLQTLQLLSSEEAARVATELQGEWERRVWGIKQQHTQLRQGAKIYLHIFYLKSLFIDCLFTVFQPFYI